MRRMPSCSAVAAARCWVAARSLGADPQPYAVTLKPTGNAALDTRCTTPRSSSRCGRRRRSARSPWWPRAGRTPAASRPRCSSFGYYAAKVTVTIAGQPLDDPDLPDLLEHAPADPPVAVVASFDPGPLFHLGRVTVEGDVPPAAREQLGLAPGAPAVAADVLAAQQRLLAAIREDGYPLAKVELPPVTLRPAEDLLDVTFDVDRPGRTPISARSRITGLQTVNEDFVRRRLLLHSGRAVQPGQATRRRART